MEPWEVRPKDLPRLIAKIEADEDEIARADAPLFALQLNLDDMTEAERRKALREWQEHCREAALPGSSDPTDE